MGYLHRMLADWSPSLALAALAAVLAASGRHWLAPAAWVHEGICRELLHGTTEGRQALVGSGWHAPLVTLAGLPAAALLPTGATPWAAVVTSWLATACILHVVWRFAGRRIAGRAAWLPWLAAAGLPAMRELLADPERAVTVAAAVTVLVKATDWCDGRRLTDLVKLAFSLALLGLCGLPLAGWTLLVCLALPFTALAVPRIRPRFQGVLVLGVLPLLYVLAVWGLMNRVILIDGLYPLRFAGTGLLPWPGWEAVHLPWETTLGAAVCAACLAWGIVRGEAAAVVTGLLSLLLTAWLALLQAAGAPWATGPAAALLQVAAVLGLVSLAGSASARLHPARARAVAAWAALPILLAAALRLPAGVPDREPWREWRAAQDDVLQRVEAYVTSHTPFGRVFVCGYDGLGMLPGRTRPLFVPCIDLHIAALRQDYHGQNLFLLVPRPADSASLDSIAWRYPRLYSEGAERTLYAGEWNGWRLYEIITAPTAQQLEQWRGQ